MTDEKTKRLISWCEAVVEIAKCCGVSGGLSIAIESMEQALNDLQPESEYIYENVDSREKAAMYLECPCEAYDEKFDGWVMRTLAGWLDGEAHLSKYPDSQSSWAWQQARVRFRRLLEGEVTNTRDQYQRGTGEWVDAVVNNVVDCDEFGVVPYRRLVNHDGSDFDWGSLK